MACNCYASGENTQENKRDGETARERDDFTPN